MCICPFCRAWAEQRMIRPIYKINVLRLTKVNFVCLVNQVYLEEVNRVFQVKQLNLNLIFNFA